MNLAAMDKENLQISAAGAKNMLRYRWRLENQFYRRQADETVRLPCSDRIC